jgi:hypothetical protein
MSSQKAYEELKAAKEDEIKAGQELPSFVIIFSDAFCILCDFCEHAFCEFCGFVLILGSLAVVQ